MKKHGKVREEVIYAICKLGEWAIKNPWIFACICWLLGGILAGQMLGTYRCQREALRQGSPGWVVPREGGQPAFRWHEGE